ncbi:MAG: hypothetical protein Q8884_02690, partial [Sweet potato little leaf phytoplasma]|nr:hypothetical protein [Sweet potato little leaf phytoplasma]
MADFMNPARGQVDLVDSGACTQEIFAGPLHIPPDGDEQAWPFSVRIPTHIVSDSGSAFGSSGASSGLPSFPRQVPRQEMSFVPVTPEFLARQGL